MIQKRNTAVGGRAFRAESVAYTEVISCKTLGELKVGLKPCAVGY